MSLQKQFIQIVEHLDKIPGKLSIFFEAHYWGRFRLLTNNAEAFPDQQGFIPLAQIQSPPFDQWLLLDTENNRIVRRESDAEQHQLVAYSLNEFFGDPQQLQASIATGEHPYFFDRRQKLSTLLSKSDFIITEINDPEFFEELSGYTDLFRILGELTQGDLLFDKISGEENGMKKTFHLEKGARQWSIQLHRELFDNAVIHQLNDILLDCGIKDYRLSTSINEEMRMVVMKLGDQDFALLERMGILV